MKSTEKLSTEERLLRAGLSAFSQRGYKGVSIRELSAEAGTNIAAVHYHFGGKEALYRAVVNRHLEHIWPPASLLRPNEPLQSLQNYFADLLKKGVDEKSPIHALIRIRRMEEVAPTGILDDFLQHEFLGNAEVVRYFVEDWAQGEITEEEVLELTLAILSLPTTFIICRPWMEKFLPKGSYSAAGVKKYAKTIAQQAMTLMSVARAGGGL